MLDKKFFAAAAFLLDKTPKIWYNTRRIFRSKNFSLPDGNHLTQATFCDIMADGQGRRKIKVKS